MSKIYTSATQLIGHTPLLKVTNYLKDQNIEGVELLAKLEYFNPAGSVKDRIALAMIEDAEKKGILKEGCSQGLQNHSYSSRDHECGAP